MSAKEEFDELKNNWAYESVRILAFDDETFGKLAKELKAKTYGTDEMP